MFSSPHSTQSGVVTAANASQLVTGARFSMRAHAGREQDRLQRLPKNISWALMRPESATSCQRRRNGVNHRAGSTVSLIIFFCYFCKGSNPRNDLSGSVRGEIEGPWGARPYVACGINSGRAGDRIVGAVGATLECHTCRAPPDEGSDSGDWRKRVASHVPPSRRASTEKISKMQTWAGRA